MEIIKVAFSSSSRELEHESSKPRLELFKPMSSRTIK